MLHSKDKAVQIATDLTALKSLSTHIAHASTHNGLDKFSQESIGVMLSSISKRHDMSTDDIDVNDPSGLIASLESLQSELPTKEEE